MASDGSHMSGVALALGGRRHFQPIRYPRPDHRSRLHSVREASVDKAFTSPFHTRKCRALGPALSLVNWGVGEGT